MGQDTDNTDTGDARDPTVAREQCKLALLSGRVQGLWRGQTGRQGSSQKKLPVGREEGLEERGEINGTVETSNLSEALRMAEEEQTLQSEHLERRDS